MEERYETVEVKWCGRCKWGEHSTNLDAQGVQACSRGAVGAHGDRFTSGIHTLQQRQFSIHYYREKLKQLSFNRERPGASWSVPFRFPYSSKQASNVNTKGASDISHTIQRRTLNYTPLSNTVLIDFSLPLTFDVDCVISMCAHLSAFAQQHGSPLVPWSANSPDKPACGKIDTLIHEHQGSQWICTRGTNNTAK